MWMPLVLGVREEHAQTVTSFWRGTFDTDPDLRHEFLAETRAPTAGR
jgi:GTP cyclohydrolase I